MSAALKLFVEYGYTETTVDQIAAATGISRRSFFRYFPSKEGVVLGGLKRMGERLNGRLAEIPAEVPCWAALRQAFEVLIEPLNRSPQESLPLVRLRMETPALQGYYFEQISGWPKLLRPNLVDRFPEQLSADDPRPHAMAGAALACLDAAETSWIESGAKKPFSLVLDQAMGALGELS